MYEIKSVWNTSELKFERIVHFWQQLFTSWRNSMTDQDIKSSNSPVHKNGKTNVAISGETYAASGTIKKEDCEINEMNREDR